MSERSLSFRHHDAMRPLDYAIQFAVWRALHNIWQGENAPIEEAIQYMARAHQEHLVPTHVTQAIAEYVSLVVRHLMPMPPLVAEVLDTYAAHLLSCIGQDQERLQELEQELGAERQHLWQHEQQVTALRKRANYLAGQENYLQRRIATLEQAEGRIQAQLAQIARQEPVTLERSQALAVALAAAIETDLPRAALSEEVPRAATQPPTFSSASQCSGRSDLCFHPGALCEEEQLPDVPVLLILVQGQAVTAYRASPLRCRQCGQRRYQLEPLTSTSGLEEEAHAPLLDAGNALLCSLTGRDLQHGLDGTVMAERSGASGAKSQHG